MPLAYSAVGALDRSVSRLRSTRVRASLLQKITEMDASALEQAKERLRRGERAIADLRAATNFEDAESAWTDFLQSVSAVYAKLEQGSKLSGKSGGWYGRKKKERKSDPLLSYLHAARNSNEHGIIRVVKRFEDTGPIFGRQPKFGERVPITFQSVDPVTGELTGDPFSGFYSGSTIKLVRVNNTRFNHVCDPPQTHLGVSVPFFEEPLDVGELALSYLRAMLAEATCLLVSDP